MDQKSNDLDAARAAHWYARLRADDCSLAERRAFQAWLAQDPGHGRAYEQAKQLSRNVERLARVDPRMRQLAAAAALREQVAPVLRWRFAAVLLVGIGLAAMLVLQQGSWGRSGAVAVLHYANSGTRQQLVELADGSRVHLDVGARLEARIGKAERFVDLQEGRAYFEVAHDAARPFSVQAGGTRTVALGTRFQVAVASQAVSVTLTEGSVAVSRAGPDGWNEVLRPGEQLQFSSASGNRKRHDIDTALVVGWSYGRLVFRATPLTDALTEINRYAAVKLRLGDNSLGDVPIGGTFVAGADSTQVAAALTAALPLSAVQVGASEIVLFRRYETAD